MVLAVVVAWDGEELNSTIAAAWPEYQWDDAITWAVLASDEQLADATELGVMAGTAVPVSRPAA